MVDSRPKLRPVEAHPVMEDGRPFILLRDPLALSEGVLLVPGELAPLLALCDGTRDVDGLGAALAIRFGIRVRPELLRQFVQMLDDALLLENERSAAARQSALESYRAAPFRQPTLAGKTYPADPDQLAGQLEAYLDGADGPAPSRTDGLDIRGLVTPHIDYERGSTVYAQVWRQAAAAARAAERVIILGTDHHGGGADVTLTRQSYATPFGVLPTPSEAVERLAAAIGEDTAFAGELSHRAEHSIELAAVWLHFIRNGVPCEVIPVLCGPLARFIEQDASPENDPPLASLVTAIRELATERRTLIVAAADLAHVGPAFGGAPLDFAARLRLQSADDERLQRICEGDAGGFLSAIRQMRNRDNVCGVSSIYLVLRALGAPRGERVAYAVCPADDHGTSAVTICGVVFR